MQLPDRNLPPRIIEATAKLDHFTDSGSDNQNKFEMKVQNVDELIKELEDGDEKIKKIREKVPANTSYQGQVFWASRIDPNIDIPLPATEYSSELSKLNKNIRYLLNSNVM